MNEMYFNEWLRANTKAEVRKRGLKVYEEQNLKAVPTDVGYKARVFGSSGETYEVSIITEDDKYTADCSCPYAAANQDFCKHIFALSTAILNEDTEDRNIDIYQGISDLELSHQTEDFLTVFDRSSEKQRRDFLRSLLLENQSLRMRFLQALRSD